MFDLTGKKALVTGATGGIGEAIAKALHAQGANVILSGRNQEKLQSLAKALGSNAHVLPCDLGDKEAVAGLIDEAVKLLGGLDILVANAGVTKDNLALRMKEEEWDEVINVNLKSTFILNKAAFRVMMKQRFGRIINISSVVAFSGNPGQANYVASKAGMVGMSKALAAESASRGITINCIAPGFIRTSMTEVLSDQQKEKISSSIPMGDMGTPADIAAAAVFLASTEAGYMTGQTLHVNGGMLMA
ncbi:MAG: beta-ketoacyl-ACP reductase [Rickettsiales bacterium]|jgi:3-oxoacyl-[acyl-carrier protein] reductase|nr:beta-ketoacyl-ACP reductase [Rickettsiales bacterium]